jgi:hypothetical protein
MIKSIRSSSPTFRPVIFQGGIQRYPCGSTEPASRLTIARKSEMALETPTLIETAHFCLGGQVPRGSIFSQEGLEGWSSIREFYAKGLDFGTGRRIGPTTGIVIRRLPAGPGWGLARQRQMVLATGFQPTKMNHRALFRVARGGREKYSTPHFRSILVCLDP